MKTALVISGHPDFAEAVQGAIGPDQFRVVHRAGLEEAEPLLAHGFADLCILDLELTDVRAKWSLDELRVRAPQLPVVIVAGAKDPHWEEEAYAQNVQFVLSKPLRPRLLAELVRRVLAQRATPPLTHPAPVAPTSASDTTYLTAPAPPAVPTHLLPILRTFSGVLTHSLNAEGMLRQFLVLLRDILSVNRGAVFLRPAMAGLAHHGGEGDSRRLRCYASLGISSALLQHLELSLNEGVGGQVLRLGRILRRHSDEARQDPASQKEFELLGAQVAVPMFDREAVIGVAVFDGRITGEALTNADLEIIFHLLEPIGLAVKNIWLHEQLSANHQMMAGILRELSSACVVVSRDLVLLHANKAARKHLSRSRDRSGEMEFSDLPEVLGTKVYQVVKTGAAIAPFRFSPESLPEVIYSVTIVPFQTQPAGMPASILLMAENITQSEQLRRLEVEKAMLDLILNMADRLAAETGNAISAVSIHQQLLKEKWKDPEFRDSMSRSIEDSVKRVTRLTNQMRLLARKGAESVSEFPLRVALEEAAEEAYKYQKLKPLPIQMDHEHDAVLVEGDRAALKHGLFEVLLNAVQANTEHPRIVVRATLTDMQGRRGIQLEIQDNGQGFAKEVLDKGPTPFVAKRAVGLGLGLVVAQKVLQLHGGRLEILRNEAGKPGVVRLIIPLDLT